MKADPQKRAELLEANVQPIDPQDTMVEAGRKAFLAEFIQMLKLEAGSRTGGDIEDVHHMRVATRRMRSAFRLLRRYYRPKVVRPYQRQLRKLARALGTVRDLDVLIADMTEFQTTLDDEQNRLMQPIIKRLDEERTAARNKLVALFDSKAYRRFVRDFSEFLTTPGEGARAMDKDDVIPVQVRHVLPGMILDCLASVLAYDAVLAEADSEMLHGLRIEFKRLRYAVSLFGDVLGKQGKDYITDLKGIQDQLGRLNDITVAQEHLDAHLPVPDGHVPGPLQDYIDRLNSEAVAVLAKFPAVWSRFNSRKVQTKLSSALLNLR
jgi:CHAD domain-containing protein